jgi:hypothetical protein
VDHRQAPHRVRLGSVADRAVADPGLGEAPPGPVQVTELVVDVAQVGQVDRLPGRRAELGEDRSCPADVHRRLGQPAQVGEHQTQVADHADLAVAPTGLLEQVECPLVVPGGPVRPAELSAGRAQQALGNALAVPPAGTPEQDQRPAGQVTGLPVAAPAGPAGRRS